MFISNEAKTEAFFKKIFKPSLFKHNICAYPTYFMAVSFRIAMIITLCLSSSGTHNLYLTMNAEAVRQMSMYPEFFLCKKG